MGAGDTIDLLDRPDHGVTIGAVERAYHGSTDDELLSTLADLEDLSDGWRDWARRHLRRHENGAAEANRVPTILRQPGRPSRQMRR